MDPRGRWAALAVLGLAVCGAGGACTSEAGEDDEVRRLSGERESVVALLVASRFTVGSLLVENAATGIGVLGSADVLDPTGADRDEAMQRTDLAIDGLVAVVELHEEAGRPYGQALDALDGVAALREEADALPEADGVDTNHAAAMSLSDRYVEVIDAVEAATGDMARSIEDPDLRRGAHLHVTALEQSVLESVVVRTVMDTTITGGERLDEPDEIRAVAEQVSDMTRGRAEIEESATGPYEEPARALLDQVDEAGLLTTVETALDTGQVDIRAVLDGADPRVREAWSDFLDRVEQVLIEG